MGIFHRAGRYALALVAACSLLATGASQAAPRHWILQGVTFEDGAIATGTFTYDDVSREVSMWNVAVSDGANREFFPFTYMRGNSTITVNTNWSPIPTIHFTSAGAGTPPNARTLRLTPNQLLDGAPTTVPLDLAAVAGNVECVDCDPYRLVTGGSLVLTEQPPTSDLVEVIEYYNASVDHYFITAIPQEIANLDGGLTPGWTRTGQSFLAFAIGTTGIGPSNSPVCRFFAPSATTHFYSAIAVECRNVAIDLSATWIIEAGNVFQMEMPDRITGACPQGTVPVYRVFNNRPGPNHRYTASVDVRAQMEAAGWVREGYGPNAVIMCARAPFA
jgi:hypothetical protein